MTLKYEVIVKHQTGDDYHPSLSKRAAVKLAKELTQDGNQVYISWYRSSDGQHGYLNPGGNHAITGYPW